MDTSKRKTSRPTEEHKNYWNNCSDKGRNLLKLRGPHNHRWPWPALLLPMIDIAKPTSIVECGFGTLDDYRRIRDNGFDGPYAGIEVTKDFLDLGRKTKGIDIQYGDIESIPFADNSFDLVYAKGVLEVQSNYVAGLRECIRVAKEYVLLVMIGKMIGPTKITEQNKHGLKYYLNLYNLYDILSATNGRFCLMARRGIYVAVLIKIQRT